MRHDEADWMLTGQDVRILDLNSAWHGVPPSRLMEAAGRAVADVALRRFRPRRVLVVAGLGNNGGDGAVAAHHLAQAGCAVTVLYAGDPATVRTPEARLARDRLDARRVRVERWRSLERLREHVSDSDLVVDALLGVGVAGPLREPARTIVRALNAARRPLLSIDVPTGLGGALAVRPRATVTFHARKRGMSTATCGTILVRDIGIPAAAHGIGPGDLAVAYRRPHAQSHKGQNGRVLVVGGGPYTGAPLLACLAAARTGADLVHLLAPRRAAAAAEAHTPDLIVHPGQGDRGLVEADADEAIRILPRFDALLIGPGLGRDAAAHRTAARILMAARSAHVPTVADADVLRVIGRDPRLLVGRPTVCTPHTREFQDLTGRRLAPSSDARAEAVGREARRLRTTILLKAPTAIVADSQRSKLGRAHPPGATAGGLGDVLAGAAAALLAKGAEPFRAACGASFRTGPAARAAFTTRSWGLRAPDVIEAIPDVLRDWVPQHPAAETDTV
jgi:ADP-dependent NAD(P)H-hydrate dehydratase / NAD(P)H-hydrate epimerase